jgi:DNA polymerase
LNIYIAKKIKQCNKCKDLLDSTIHPAPGEGNPDSPLVLIGEAEGQEESKQGRPFCGPAGKLTQ